MESAYYTAHKTLGFQLYLIDIAGQQVIEIERRLGTLGKLSLTEASAQIGIAPSDIGNNVIEIEVNPSFWRPTPHVVGADGCHPRALNIYLYDSLQGSLQSRRDSGDRQIITHL